MTDRDRTMSRVDRFILPHWLREEVVLHLLTCAPNEGVGMIGAHRPVQTDQGWVAEAVSFVPGTNTDQSPTHYTMDARDVIRAFGLFREQGLELGAIVHSHIASPATASVSDVSEWRFPEAIMMIVSFAQQPPDMRAWRIEEEDGLMHVRGIALQVADNQVSGKSSGDS